MYRLLPVCVLHLPYFFRTGLQAEALRCGSSCRIFPITLLQDVWMELLLMFVQSLEVC